MKPNKENEVSLPFGKYGEIRFAKTVVRLSAGGLPFHGENFDILKENLRTMCGFRNVVVEPDDEDVAINIAFDLEVKGSIRNPEGLLRAVRKKLQRAMGQSYKCLRCLDRALDYCPDCEKRKREEKEADDRDLKAELVSMRGDDEPDFHMEGEERVYEEDEAREYCQWCKEPIDECQCNPDDRLAEVDEF